MNKIIKLSMFMVASLMMTVIIAGTVNATVSETSPVFNAYDDVQLHYGEGSESDFLRLGTSGELGNDIEVCEDGTVVDLWFYVHNSTAESQNNDDFTGPGVASGTTVAVHVDSDKVARSHSVVASIDSDQTNAITDDVTITCADEDVTVTYKEVSHFGTPAPVHSEFGEFTMQGDISQGAMIGYDANGKDGVVPGCWQYRARINVQLEVNIVEEEPEETPEEITKTGSNDATTLAMLVALTVIAATATHYAIVSRRN